MVSGVSSLIIASFTIHNGLRNDVKIYRNTRLDARCFCVIDYA